MVKVAIINGLVFNNAVKILSSETVEIVESIKCVPLQESRDFIVTISFFYRIH